ncbi:MAG TPA: flavodoxin [Candidatus Fimisoma avicola]|uniref:Flavodoxin n=1 Tax=Candidatus Fimisoma avicola TaxID=2840826 RepID=A0A9D1I532_9FIRM|nr:flavodoxin [Candidatus Fimisoma avicola]
MSKVAVVYWSGTGNTEAMAEAVADGIREKGGEAVILTAGEFDRSMIEDYDSIAFGCPSMGDEELEESEFAPMFESCEPDLAGKKIALFGSYGWGDGEWMRKWEKTCKKAGAVFACDFVICNDAPDDDAVEKCRGLGKALV